VVDALIAAGGPAVLIFETLAERTLAWQQLARRSRPRGWLRAAAADETAGPVLARCLAHGITHRQQLRRGQPAGAARRIHALAAELGLPRRASPCGGRRPQRRERGTRPAGRCGWARAARRRPSFRLRQRLPRRRGHRRCDPLAGAEVVVCGRVADPSLVPSARRWRTSAGRGRLGPLAGATMAGHLLECGAQVTGGYFADPGRKDVPGLAQRRLPDRRDRADGSCIVGKADGTGGLVDTRTVKEQLLYEVHDPAAYLTPDVVADITQARSRRSARPRAPHRRARPSAPGHAEGNGLFRRRLAGRGRDLLCRPAAEARARLAMEVLRERLAGLSWPAALRPDRREPASSATTRALACRTRRHGAPRRAPARGHATPSASRPSACCAR
jgi:hypothetical protein